ncbi:transcription repressor MYB5-like [Punica granatum]|uniref:Uncharacterized protein n=2 Tax=Punica granatum TaxID=22663 RepID=A0A218W910_PUNGR|nr:transcription repressor MYB5-like [Punica granatum]XP_031400585.1 transcription repressor MYB5-like [Punica granatum]OWM69275.1 hypothetical protein CDL15_Pgr025462 [Punica granatum]PKI35341.1 hypothetical protein CRG98_044255 [Punica granatum]
MRSPSSAAAAGAGGGGGKTTPCCSKVGLKRGPWTPEEDELLSSYIKREGEGRWRTLPKRAGLLRCGKSCRLRWMNYLRPSVKRGQIAPDEEDLILRLHRLLGNRWSLIAGRIPGRTDNEIKNYWNTHLSKKLISQGIDPRTHKPLNQDQRTDNSNNESPDANSTAKEVSSSKKPLINHSIPSPSPTSNPNSASSGIEEIDKELLPDPNPTTEFENSFPINNLLPKYTDGMSNTMMRIGSHVLASHEAEEDINNYCTDDVFSSFLNSLINEEAFTASHHSQLHQQPPFHVASSSSDTLMISNPISALGLGWESAIMSSTFSQNNSEAPKRVDNYGNGHIE